MFAGHFGLAAAVKAKSPEVPLWAVMLSTQLLDVFFVPLYVTGVETIETIGEGGYGNSVIHADYTHSLIGALLITLLAGIFARRFWGKRAGLIISAVVFSHWILDLLVHRADLPILPGNLGNLPLLGFGIWKYPFLSHLIEFILVGIGIILYYRSLVPGTKGRKRWLALSTSGIMGILLIVSLFY